MFMRHSIRGGKWIDFANGRYMCAWIFKFIPASSLVTSAVKLVRLEWVDVQIESTNEDY